jgi:hypothetical protein
MQPRPGYMEEQQLREQKWRCLVVRSAANAAHSMSASSGEQLRGRNGRVYIRVLSTSGSDRGAAMVHLSFTMLHPSFTEHIEPFDRQSRVPP